MKKILALVAILSAFSLTSCGNSNTAAKAGDVTITQTELQASVDEILAERAKIDTSQMQLATGAELNRGELQFRVVVAIYDEIAKELKIEITKTELSDLRAELIAQIGGEENLASQLVAAQIPPSELDIYVRTVLTSQKLSEMLISSGITEDVVGEKMSQLIVAKSKEMGIEINPMYGTWNPETALIEETDSASDSVVNPEQG